jgi:predicted TIM-barrel fold metal-dependent hydrolase
MQPAIDAHVHLSEFVNDALRHFANLNGLMYTFSELNSLMAESGTEASLLLSPPLLGGGIVPNERIISLCSSSGGKLHPIITVEPSEKEVSSALSLASSHRESVKGFKVRLGYVEKFPCDPVLDRLYDYAVSESLPVLFHTGDTADPRASLRHAHPLNLDELANRRTELKIVACHFGNPWLDDVAELIYKHQNVFADISGMAIGGGRYSREHLKALARRLSECIYYAGGADRVLYGTDYPVSTPSVSMQLVSLLEVSSKDKRKILYSNSKELFDL